MIQNCCSVLNQHVFVIVAVFWTSGKAAKNKLELRFSSAVIWSCIPTGKRSSWLCLFWEYQALFLAHIWSFLSCGSWDNGILLRLFWDIFLLLKSSPSSVYAIICARWLNVFVQSSYSIHVISTSSARSLCKSMIREPKR